MVRTFSEKVYGIPPEQVVGSTIATEYRVKDGLSSIVRRHGSTSSTTRPGSRSAIQKFIGRRPILAFGNSDGDFEMLEWTTSGPGPRLGLILHHDDADAASTPTTGSPTSGASPPRSTPRPRRDGRS